MGGNDHERATPRVTVVAPCRNECHYVRSFAQSVLSQELNGLELTLIIADGLSDDGTRTILEEIAREDHRVVVIDNPGRIVSCGLNLAVAVSTSDYIVRMDLHTHYASDYVARCVEVLLETGAACVGGAWRARATGRIQGAIACAFQSRFGSGGAASRREDFSGPVDTVYLGAWKRSTLIAVGGFDEALVRNQDDELNFRLKRSGGQIWQDRRIRSEYAPRASYAALFRQFSQYGYWKPFILRKHGMPASVRQLIPSFTIILGVVLFVCALQSSLAAGLLFCGVILYGALLAAAALEASHRSRVPDVSLLGTMAACATMHAAYGLGYLGGIVDFLILRRKGGATRMSALTR